jgi:D-3-phosphoglycerate dehydrogenase
MSERLRIVVTCPPMLGAMKHLAGRFAEKGVTVETPNVIQTLSESQLVALVPGFDGWIIGDDPASRRVFSAGRAGRLRAAVKWGVGMDNVDLDACTDLGIAIANTPGVFGREVADVAMSYVTALARETFLIDRGVRQGGWPKPAGISLAGKIVGLVGFGDIGRQIARRLIAAEMKVIVYDPRFQPHRRLDRVEPSRWPDRLDEADFLILCCALTAENRHMLNTDTLARTKRGVRLVNVARGPLIDETALLAGLETGQVHSAALDVFEVEPLPVGSALRRFERCVFGSHNSSNTVEAVVRTSHQAIDLLFDFLSI